MFNKLSTILILTSILTLTSSQNAKQPSIISSVNSFGLKLLKQLYDGESNVFHSPMSIVAALTMAMLGADGDTYEEINKTLEYTKDSGTVKEEWQSVIKTVINGEGKNVLTVANKMIAKKKARVLDKFKEQLKPFDAEIEVVKDGIEKSVNDWVNKKTKGMIPSLIDEPIPEAVLVLVNAIYFQGYWLEPMEKSKTDENGLFYNYGKEKKKLGMMHHETEAWFSKSDDFGGFKMLQLPYKKTESQKFKMLLLLPNSYIGLQTLVDGLTIEKLNKIKKSMQEKHVIIEMPRFKIDSNYELKHQLPKLGIVKAFGDADFSGINGAQDLYISSVIHKAVIEVDESGTKAAAATAVVFETKAAEEVIYEEPPETFKADHPFLYFIIDDITGMMLFGGTVNAL